MSKYPVGVVALLALAFTSLGISAALPSTADRAASSCDTSTAPGR